MTSPDISIDITETAVVVSTDGIQGPPGPQGPPGTSGGTRFEEPFTNASVIVVNHNFGYEPLTSIIISGEEVDADVIHGSVNQLTVTLGVPASGKVVCV